MSQFIFTAGAFLLALGILVIVHEYGHYAVARLMGVKVLRFSVGFGRILYSKRRGKDGTEWVIAAIPLGGYVKMLDEQEGDVAPEELPRSFNRQAVWRRMLIVVAGPVANLLLAVLVYWAVYCYGTAELRPILGEPPVASAAAEAGIQSGERVVKVGEESVLTWQEMRWRLLEQAAVGETLALQLITPDGRSVLRHLNVQRVASDGWQGDAMDKLGIQFYRPSIPPILGKILADSAAQRAGLLPGDEIRYINNTEILSWLDLIKTVIAAPNLPLEFEFIRAGKTQRLFVTPDAVLKDGQNIGRIGAMAQQAQEARNSLNERMVTVRYGLLPGLVKALKETLDKSLFNLAMIGKMITGEVSWRNISGPVTIADYAGQSAKMGVPYYLNFLAIISISLGVLNLLPIPILDGGHLLYYVLEIIRRKPLSPRSMELGQRLGMALILLLMVCAFYNDFNRLFFG